MKRLLRVSQVMLLAAFFAASVGTAVTVIPSSDVSANPCPNNRCR